MTIDDDLNHLPTLEYIARALTQFVRSLEATANFILKGKKSSV